MNIKSSPESGAPLWSLQPTATNTFPFGPRGEVLEGLRRLDYACGPSVSKHDRAIVLIHACIDQGANTRAQIMAHLTPLGFNKGHIAIVLSAGTGDDPSRHRWSQRPDKTFVNFPENEAGAG
jgi:hypothetical protein